MVYFITFCFVMLDMITGLIKAFKEKSYTSSIMREGLFHKIGSVLCVVFASLVDYAQSFIDLGVNIPIVLTVCGYIVLMEIGSIIENICLINPEIAPNTMKSYFVKLKEKE